MEQVRVHRCDKAIWLFTCLSFLTIASVLVIVILYMPDLPRWIAYGLPGAFAALACFSVFIAFSRYEVRGGRLFLVSLAGAREGELRWEKSDRSRPRSSCHSIQAVGRRYRSVLDQKGSGCSPRAPQGPLTPMSAGCSTILVHAGFRTSRRMAPNRLSII